MANKILEKLANVLHMHYDADTSHAYNTANGYTYIVRPYTQQNIFVSEFCVCDQNGNKPVDVNLRALKESVQNVSSAKAMGNRILITFKSAFTENGRNEKIAEALPEIIQWLRINGYQNCAEESNLPADTKVVIYRGITHFYTEEMIAQTVQQESQTPEVKENLPLGILLALGGVTVGAILIVVIGQLGYISLVAGAAMGFLTLQAYQKGAGKLSVIGIVICFILIIIAVYVANKLNWALYLTTYFHENGYGSVRMMDAYNVLPEMMKEGYIEKLDYFKELALQYLAAIGGSVGSLAGVLNGNKMAAITKVLG